MRFYCLYIVQDGLNGFHLSGNWGNEMKVKDLEELKHTIASLVQQYTIDVVGIHNVFDSDIADYLTTIRPVVKFSHSPVIVCPGKDKYWRYSKIPCSKPYGLHCFWHVYTQGCSNRHPRRIWKDWHFVRKELQRARNTYHKVIVMSEYNKQRLLELGVSSGKVVVNPYFTKEVTVKPLRGNISEITRLLFIGRIIEGKGVSEMVDAVQEVLLNHDDVLLDIIGDGLQFQAIKQKIERLGLSNKIKMHGWLSREKIDEFLANCHLVIFPSTYPESFGIVGIEAMMYGKPVVAFDVGGVSTWLKHGETGVLIPPGDLKALGDAVEMLITDNARYLAMSHMSRELALAKYTAGSHMKALLQTFKEAATA
jgi:Glycosyltransferase